MLWPLGPGYSNAHRASTSTIGPWDVSIAAVYINAHASGSCSDGFDAVAATVCKVPSICFKTAKTSSSKFLYVAHD